MEEFWGRLVGPGEWPLTLGTGAGFCLIQFKLQIGFTSLETLDFKMFLLNRSGCSLGFISGWADQRLDSITFHWRCPRGPQQVFTCLDMARTPPSLVFRSGRARESGKRKCTSTKARTFLGDSDDTITTTSDADQSSRPWIGWF